MRSKISRLSPVLSIVLALLLYIVGLGKQISAQSAQTLSLEEYLSLVERNHPIARQARLLSAQAQERMRVARGGFDPKLYGEAEQKVFKETNYYRYIEGGLKVPTRLGGIEGKINYENNTGQFLNPEATVPQDGLIKTGVSVPLAQGLLIDSRRAALRQAKILIQANENERILQINTLLQDAQMAYWDWALSYWNQEVLRQAVDLTQFRRQATEQAVILGDKPSIDTLEASIQLRSRQLALFDAILAYQKATAYLGVFLWDNEGRARTLPPSTVPLSPPNLPLVSPLPDSLGMLLQQMAAHPMVKQYDYKSADLEVQRRLKTDKFKPDLRVEVSMLTDPTAFEGETSPMGGYFWGGTFNLPILYRKVKGEVELTRIKIRENDLKRSQKTQELRAKLLASQAEVETLRDQQNRANQNADAYQRLLQAENDKFRLGESSLFLVNSRESKLIEARLKLLSLQAKYQKALVTWQWLTQF